MYKLISVFIFVFAEILANQHSQNYRGRGLRVRHEVHTNTSGDARQCNLDQLEYRIRALETQILERSEATRSEVRQSNYRLRNLEKQTTNIETILDNLRREINPSSPSKNLELEIDNLAKGMQIIMAALRGINTRIGHTARDNPSQNIPRNCHDLLERGTNISGVYLVQPRLSPRAFMVLCDMETAGGGWTYIHNRYDGTQDFHLGWGSYKTGFGNLGGEFWSGLENLHHLTGSEVNELLVDLVDQDGNRVYAHYAAFSVGSEEEGYALKVLAGYSGTAGDSLSYHAGSRFSTKDKDQDEWKEGSCAQAHTGAWWYKNCDKSNLNGRYLKGEVTEDDIFHGMYWSEFHGAQYSLLRARMMVRPRVVANIAKFSDWSDVSPN